MLRSFPWLLTPSKMASLRMLPENIAVGFEMVVGPLLWNLRQCQSDFPGYCDVLDREQL